MASILKLRVKDSRLISVGVESLELQVEGFVFCLRMCLEVCGLGFQVEDHRLQVCFALRCAGQDRDWPRQRSHSQCLHIGCWFKV